MQPIKSIILFNLLVFSGLALNGQNYLNANTQLAYNNNTLNNQQLALDNNSDDHMNIQSRGGASRMVNNINTNKTVQNKTNLQTKKVVIKQNTGNQFNNTSIVNDVNLNSNSQAPIQGNVININSNPFVDNNHNNINKVVSNKPIVTEEYKGLDFKPSGLSGRGYTGGKLKKGHKNFYQASVSKSKNHISKRKPSFKKIKHHTSKCASW